MRSVWNQTNERVEQEGEQEEQKREKCQAGQEVEQKQKRQKKRFFCHGTQPNSEVCVMVKDKRSFWRLFLTSHLLANIHTIHIPARQRCNRSISCKIPNMSSCRPIKLSSRLNLSHINFCIAARRLLRTGRMTPDQLCIRAVRCLWGECPNHTILKLLSSKTRESPRISDGLLVASFHMNVPVNRNLCLVNKTFK